MQEAYELPVELRPRLAKPLGRLFPAGKLSSDSFARMVSLSPMLVSVGDRVTETIWSMGRAPDVQVVDSRENRKARKPPDVPYVRLVKVKNPAGTIMLEALDGMREAFGGSKPVRVLVDGEEDLLAIPAVVFAPISSTIVYGQPGEGIVAVSVEAKSKARSRAILAQMGITGLR